MSLRIRVVIIAVVMAWACGAYRRSLHGPVVTVYVPSPCQPQIVYAPSLTTTALTTGTLASSALPSAATLSTAASTRMVVVSDVTSVTPLVRSAQEEKPDGRR